MHGKGSPKRLRIGVLGCGPIAQAAHFDACRKARNAELYAICDASDDLVAKMRAVHEPQATYTEFDEMLADPKVEAVIVAVADQYHAALTLRAIDAGKHVLVEKPLGVTVEECERVRDQADAAGVRCHVGSMKRFDPGIAFARDFIANEIGELLAVKAWYCDSTYRYTMTDNLQPVFATGLGVLRPDGDPKRDRAHYFLLGHGSHLVDTARFLGGPIVAVRARMAEKFGAYSWFIDTEFANGSLGHLDLTVAVRMDWHEGFQVYGEHGSVIGKTYNPWFLRSSDVECFSTRDGQFHRPLGADGHAYRRQIEGFAAAILDGGETQAATAEDGLEAVRALVAISRSVKIGERVELASVSGGV